MMKLEVYGNSSIIGMYCIGLTLNNEEKIFSNRLFYYFNPRTYLWQENAADCWTTKNNVQEALLKILPKFTSVIYPTGFLS
jgi:hypothetical protein